MEEACEWCRAAHGTVKQGLLPTARALLVMLQGIWFIQAAQILFTGETGPCLPLDSLEDGQLNEKIVFSLKSFLKCPSCLAVHTHLQHAGCSCHPAQAY